MIKKEEILNFQKEWGNGIVSIGNTFKNDGDYTSEAKDFINKFDTSV